MLGHTVQCSPSQPLLVSNDNDDLLCMALMCDVDFFHVMTNTSSVFFYPVSPQACYCACVASHSLSVVCIVSSQSPCTTLSHPPFIQMYLL